MRHSQYGVCEKPRGADRVIDYKTEDIGRAIRHWSAEGVDVVLDVIGSTTLPPALGPEAGWSASSQ